MKFGLKNKVLQQIQTVFADFPAVEEVVIYGSRAKGTYRLGSDIDLTLKGQGINLKLMNEIGLRLDDLLLPYTFDISLYHQIKDPDLLAHIQRVGAVLFYRHKAEF